MRIRTPDVLLGITYRCSPYKYSTIRRHLYGIQIIIDTSGFVPGIACWLSRSGTLP
jgi:hypothetical protein